MTAVGNVKGFSKAGEECSAGTYGKGGLARVRMKGGKKARRKFLCQGRWNGGLSLWAGWGTSREGQVERGGGGLQLKGRPLHLGR